MSHTRNNEFSKSLLCSESCRGVGEVLEFVALALENSGQELVQTLHPSTHNTSCCNEWRDRFLLDVTNQYERENSSTGMPEPLPHPEHFPMGRSIVVSTDILPSIQSWLQVAKDLSLVKSEEVIL